MIVPTYEISSKEQDLIISKLQRENQELKKQLEDYKKWYQNELEENYRLSQLWCDSKLKIIELETQQKEFKEYLEEPIKIITDGNPTNISEYTAGKLDALKEILSKYKEIIGEKDE